MISINDKRVFPNQIIIIELLKYDKITHFLYNLVGRNLLNLVDILIYQSIYENSTKSPLSYHNLNDTFFLKWLNRRRKMPWINVVRAVAALVVVMVHSAAPYLYVDFGVKWWTGNIFDSLSRIGVPLFFMITGAVFLHKDEPQMIFYKKRASRILFPLLFWSLIYYLYVNLYVNDGIFDIVIFIQKLFSNDIHYHLWNLYAFILIYLMVPILRKVVKHIPVNYILFYAIVSGLIPTVSKWLVVYDIKLAIFSNPFSSALAYVLLGYAITHKGLYIKHIKLYGVLAVLTIIIGTYLFTDYNGSFHGIFYDRFGIAVMIYATTIFMVIKSNATRLEHFGKSKLIKTLNNCSFGIYLIHPLFLSIYRKEIPKEFFEWSYGIPALFTLYFITLISSFLAILVLKKVPILKRAA